MQELYNCKRIDATHYRITKFDKHLNPKYDKKGNQSSYTVSANGCDCPQGNGQTCRHRKMLPSFAKNGYIDSGYFFVWDTQQWYKPTGIFAEARKEKAEQVLQELEDFVERENQKAISSVNSFEGGTPSPVSAVPSPQPSPKPTYRRF